MARTGMVSYGGRNFYRYEGNPYFWTKHWPSRGKSTSLHVFVWTEANGPVPDGFQVHHARPPDLRDFATTDVTQLEIMSRHAHARLHAFERQEAGTLRVGFTDEDRARAATWHASPEGLEHHAANGKALWEARPYRPVKCRRCEATFQTRVLRPEPGFCAPACRSAWRREQGLDDVDAACQRCGAAFRTNRFRPHKKCSDCR